MSEVNNYLEDRADADELIAEFGQAGTLRRKAKTGPAHNPTISTEDFSVTLVVIDYSNREIDGTRVLATDKKVLIKAGGLEIIPGLDDAVLIGGVSHSIVRLMTLAPGGVTVLYEAQCRR